MTDARYPERWLNDRRVLLLSDAGHRLFVTAMVWSVSNRSDGVLTRDDLALMPRISPDLAGELVKAGLWSEAKAGGWLIVDYATTQTTRASLEAAENARLAERDRKRGERARKVSLSAGRPADDTGQARKGKERLGTEEGDQQQTEPEKDWPTVAPLGAVPEPEPLPTGVWASDHARAQRAA